MGSATTRKMSSDTTNQDADNRLAVHRANASEASSQTLDDRTLFLESKSAQNPTYTSEREGLSDVASREATVTHQPKMQPTDTRAFAAPAYLNHHGQHAMLAGPVRGEVPKSSKPIFPEFLMEVLNDEAGQNVLRWMPCGTQFCITNYRKFVSEEMERLFHIKHMSSFTRKLNRWGFVREFVDGNLDIFRHPSFRRDQPTLCRSMQNVIGDRSKKSNPRIKHITADNRNPNVHEVSPEASSGQRDHRLHPVVVYHHQYTAPTVPQQQNNRLDYHRNTSPDDNSRYLYNHQCWGS